MLLRPMPSNEACIRESGVVHFPRARNRAGNSRRGARLFANAAGERRGPADAEGFASCPAVSASRVHHTRSPHRRGPARALRVGGWSAFRAHRSVFGPMAARARATVLRQSAAKTSRRGVGRDGQRCFGEVSVLRDIRRRLRRVSIRRSNRAPSRGLYSTQTWWHRQRCHDGPPLAMVRQLAARPPIEIVTTIRRGACSRRSPSICRSGLRLELSKTATTFGPPTSGSRCCEWGTVPTRRTSCRRRADELIVLSSAARNLWFAD